MFIYQKRLVHEISVIDVFAAQKKCENSNCSHKFRLIDRSVLSYFYQAHGSSLHDLLFISVVVQSGGFTKDTDPLPMILRSGDILIMGGKSRLRVHAVPKVYTKSLPPGYLHPSTAGRDAVHLADCPCFLDRGISLRCCSGGDDSDSRSGCSSSSNKNDNSSDSSSSSSSSSCSSSSSRGSDRLDIDSDRDLNSKTDINRPHSDNITNDNGGSPSHKRRKNSASGYESDGALTAANSRDKHIRSSCMNADINGCKTFIVEGESEQKKEEIPRTKELETDSTDSTNCTDCPSSLPRSRCLLVEREVRALRFLQTTRININVRQVYSDSSSLIA